MVCPACVPVVTNDPEGNYIRTDCRECGMTMSSDEVDAATGGETVTDEVTETPTCDFVDGQFYCVLPPHGDDVQHGGYLDDDIDMDAEAMQAVYDLAFADGILDEPKVFDPADGVVAVRIEDGNLIETVAPADAAAE